MTSNETPPLPAPAPLTRRHWRLAAAWFAGALALAWFGNGAHSLWDRDEPRYAVATREMITSGDWVVPTFNGGNRYDKPPLIYWLMSVPMRLWGVNEFSARAASGLAGAAAVALVFLFALRLGAAPRSAALAALALLLSPIALMIAKASTTDATLTLAVAAAMFLHWEQGARGFAWWRHGLFWAVLGAAALLKGPPALAIAGLAIAAERLTRVYRGWREGRAGAEFARFPRGLGRFAAGLALFFALTLPWAILAWRRTEGEYFQIAIGRHVIERASRALESHRGPIVYYLPILLISFFPFLAFGPVALRWMWARRREAAVRFLWLWILPAFVMFSLVKTKLPHYVAPLIPALALGLGLWWDRLAAGEAAAGRGWWRAGGALSILAGVAAAVGLPAAVAFAPFPAMLAPALALGGILGVSGVWAGALWWRGHAARGLAPAAGGFALVLLLGFLWALPALEPLRPSKRIASAIRESAPPAARLIAVDYQEPTLVFYWGGQVTMLGKRECAEGFARLARADEPWALVTTAKRWREWLDWLDANREARPPRMEILHEARYYDFQKGRWLDLVAVANWPAQRENPAGTPDQ